MRIRTRLRLGFAGQILLTVALGAGAIVTLESANHRFTHVAEHQAVTIARARHLTQLVIDMETGQRGFCITGEEEFLEPYVAGRAAFDALLAEELRRLADEPAQRAMMEEVGRLVERWQATAARPEIAMARRVIVARAKARALDDVLDADPDGTRVIRLVALARGIERRLAARGDERGASLAGAIAASLIERDAGLRGFVASGDARALGTYTTAEQRLSSLFDQLREGGAVGPEDTDALAQLDVLTGAWTTNTAAPAIAARRELDAYPETSEDVAALLQKRTGKALVDRIRKVLGQYIALEEQQVDAHYAAADRMAAAVRIVVLVVLIAAVLLAGWLARATSRAIAGPIAELARGADRIGQGDLDTRVPAAAVDELQSLSDAFNTMARKLGEASRARQQAEDALFAVRNLESLGTLAGGIAHDFNNILTGIQGNLSLALADAPPDDELHALLLEAQSATSTATGLTRQLLTFAKGGEPRLTAVELGPLVMEVATFSTRGSRSKCVFEISDDLLPVRVDPDQLSQVLQNIVLNATQAMPDGGLVHISARNVVADGAAPRVRVAITDEGVGIPEADRARIFDLYYSTKDEGRGLGLATSHSIITRHGGTLTVHSEEGVGTTFAFTLPATPDARIEPETPTDPPAPGEGRVLVMDDDAAVLKTIERMLDKLGYACELTPDGQRMLKAYREAFEAGAPYDVVIMDLTIPGGLGGREASALLKALDPDARTIASSGYSNDPILADHAAYGFDDVLAKPYTLRAVSEVLSRFPPRQPA